MPVAFQLSRFARNAPTSTSPAELNGVGNGKRMPRKSAKDRAAQASRVLMSAGFNKHIIASVLKQAQLKRSLTRECLLIHWTAETRTSLKRRAMSAIFDALSCPL